MMVLGLVVALVLGYIFGCLHRVKYIQVAVLEGRRSAFRLSQQLAEEYAQFELADTEGRAGQRIERAQVAYDIARELSTMAGDARPV